MACLSAASAPLAVELFCSRALGVLLRMAQRRVAAQPHGHQDGIVVMIMTVLMDIFKAFGPAVPQARPHFVPPSSPSRLPAPC